MLTIGEKSLTISGHSGKNIVCAALSSAACGAAIHWEKNPKMKIEVNEKKILISFKLIEPDPRLEIELAFLTSLLKTLAYKNPKYIKCIEK